MVRGKQFLFLLAIIAVLVVSTSFVSAVTFNILDFENYTSTITFNCSQTTLPDVDNKLNATIYYNQSGGAAGDALVTGHAVLNSSANTTSDEYYGTTSITGLTDDLSIYNFSCAFYNGTDANDYQFAGAAANITIANDVFINVTEFLIFNNTLDAHNNYGNFSGNMTFNATINISIAGGNTSADGFGYLDSVYFNLSLDGVEDIFWRAIEDVANSIPYNETLDTLNGSFSDNLQGYKLCVYANSSIASVINFTECYTINAIDNNAPSVSLTRSSSSTTDSIVLTIAPGETGSGVSGSCTTDRGTLSTLSITASNLNCGEPYSFTVTCTDYMNLVGSKTSSFSTDDCGSSAPSGGGAAVTGTTFTASTEQLSTGYTRSISVNDQIKFSIGTAKHTLRASSITPDKITITVSSTPQTATMAIGDERRFDLDDNGIYDVQVKLNGITAGKADLTLTSIEITVTPETKAEEAAKEEGAAEEEVAEEEAAANLTWLWIVLAVIVIIVIIYFIAKKKR